MGEKEIQPLLEKYINEPSNPETNFWLAWEYDKIGQNAAALSYYLRCAELSDDEDLVYECLLKTWLMIHRTGRRPWYEHKQLLTAITQNPKRPEAYFFLSRIHSEKGEWKDCYYYASTGLKLCDPNPKPLRTNVDYPGDYILLFQKAYSSWFVGQREECKRLWAQVCNHPDLQGDFKIKAHQNLQNFGIDPNPKQVENKIDIVLQGQYSEYALETAKYYLNLDFVNNVIISCWMEDKLPSVSINNILFTQNILPKVNGTGNRNYQIVSSLGGLKLVNTEFAIKMRNDQRYDLNSMENMFDFFQKNKERLVTFEGDDTKPKNRILVGGAFEGFPFHPRDHVFWGNTEDLIDLFDIPLDPRGIEDIVKMKREDYWKYYDCYIRTESYIGSHYCSKFNDRIKKYLLKPDQYLHDGAPYYNEALELSNDLSKKVFKSFPKEGIDLEWDKYNWKNYPYDSQYSKFNERWHEDGY
jgi:hypothetical protein